jgi:hypothetical protein
MSKSGSGETNANYTTTGTMTGDHDTITLADAAQHFGFTVSTLRAEAGRGRLTIYKIGKRYYTTPNDIREMVSQCRVEQKAPAFTVTRRAVNTSSEMAHASFAAEQALMRLRSTSRNTSRPSTAQRQARGR